MPVQFNHTATRHFGPPLRVPLPLVETKAEPVVSEIPGGARLQKLIENAPEARLSFRGAYPLTRKNFLSGEDPNIDR